MILQRHETNGLKPRGQHLFVMARCLPHCSLLFSSPAPAGLEMGAIATLPCPQRSFSLPSQRTSAASLLNLLFRMLSNIEVGITLTAASMLGRACTPAAPERALGPPLQGNRKPLQAPSCCSVVRKSCCPTSLQALPR